MCVEFYAHHMKNVSTFLCCYFLFVNSSHMKHFFVILQTRSMFKQCRKIVFSWQILNSFIYFVIIFLVMEPCENYAVTSPAWSFLTKSTADSCMQKRVKLITLKLGMTVDLWKPYYAHACFDDLDLYARSQWYGKGKKSALHVVGSKASNKHETCYKGRPFLLDLDFASVHMAFFTNLFWGFWPVH